MWKYKFNYCEEEEKEVEEEEEEEEEKQGRREKRNTLIGKFLKMQIRWKGKLSKK